MKVHYILLFTFLLPYFSLFKKSQRKVFIQKVVKGQPFKTAILEEGRKSILNKSNLLDILLQKPS